MDSPEDPLKRLVKAARKAPLQEVDKPPQAEISSLREKVRMAFLTLTWRRISLLAALIAGIAFAIFYFMVREDQATQPPASPTVPDFPKAP